MVLVPESDLFDRQSNVSRKKLVSPFNLQEWEMPYENIPFCSVICLQSPGVSNLSNPSRSASRQVLSRFASGSDSSSSSQSAGVSSSTAVASSSPAPCSKSSSAIVETSNVAQVLTPIDFQFKASTFATRARQSAATLQPDAPSSVDLIPSSSPTSVVIPTSSSSPDKKHLVNGD